MSFLSEVNVITLAIFKTPPCLSLKWSISNFESDWHVGKNAVTLFIINKNIYPLCFLQVQYRPRGLLALNPCIHRGECRNLFSPREGGRARA